MSKESGESIILTKPPPDCNLLSALHHLENCNLNITKNLFYMSA